MTVAIIIRGRLSEIWTSDMRHALGIIHTYQSLYKVDDYWFTACPEVPF